LKEGTYQRVITHEITPKAVINAIEHPVDFNMNLIDAGLSRLIVDKSIGYGLTPEAKAYLGVKSVGRCQSIGLKLIVDREDQINNFIPETYYDLFLEFEKNGTKFKAKYQGEKITTKKALNKIIQSCSSDFIISKIDKREKKESPKPPFCTVTFQQEASNKLGLSVSDAQKIAQTLFQNAYISYHRTDDTEMSVDFLDNELKPFVEKNYKVFNIPNKGKTSKTDQNGHECLRITDPSLTPEEFAKINSNNMQQKVYNLIWKRTIASVLNPAIISETKYIISNSGYDFILVSNELIEAGYRQVYNITDNKEKIIKETFVEKEKLNNTELKSEELQTQPPTRYTEATLVNKLKELGVGRPSTYATIVETVTSNFRGYADIAEKKIVPTEKGIVLSKYLDRNFSNIINLNYTKEMEENLDKIAEGSLTKLEFLKTFYKNLNESIENNKEKAPIVEKNSICPECGGQLTIKRSRFGKLFKGCSNYPNCKHIENIN
jgi:DNA topoisomerase I